MVKTLKSTLYDQRRMMKRMRIFELENPSDRLELHESANSSNLNKVFGSQEIIQILRSEINLIELPQYLPHSP